MAGCAQKLRCNLEKSATEQNCDGKTVAKHITIRFNTFWEPFIIVLCEKQSTREQAQAGFGCGFRKKYVCFTFPVENQGRGGFPTTFRSILDPGFSTNIMISQKTQKVLFSIVTAGVLFLVRVRGPPLDPRFSSKIMFSKNRVFCEFQWIWPPFLCAR